MVCVSDPALAEAVHGVGAGSVVTKTVDYEIFDHVSLKGVGCWCWVG